MHETKEAFYLYCGQDDARVRVLELGYDTFAYMLALACILGSVPAERVENRDTSPF